MGTIVSPNKILLRCPSRHPGEPWPGARQNGPAATEVGLGFYGVYWDSMGFYRAL